MRQRRTRSTPRAMSVQNPPHSAAPDKAVFGSATCRPEVHGGACPSPTIPSPVVLAEALTGTCCSLAPPRGPWRDPAAASVKGRAERAEQTPVPRSGPSACKTRDQDPTDTRTIGRQAHNARPCDTRGGVAKSKPASSSQPVVHPAGGVAESNMPTTTRRACDGSLAPNHFGLSSHPVSYPKTTSSRLHLVSHAALNQDGCLCGIETSK